jgi:acetolactate synthase I/II/III large subunit
LTEINTKYADQFMSWLAEEGYTHCFFVGGGNVMHLLESASKIFKCIPVVHEVAAGIATEYFNELNDGGLRAFALVTAGPGLTNIVTAVAGAFLESRELLVVGGQAKVSDLSRGLVPQIGHQEIDGVGIVKPITKYSILADRRLSKSEVKRITEISRNGRKGPVFIEMCLDISAMPQITEIEDKEIAKLKATAPNSAEMIEVKELLSKSLRPLILIGGGVNRLNTKIILSKLQGLGIPIATTWNGFDRIPYSYDLYAGRPNTYGMRWANIVNQSADLVIAVGTRLGIQQVGFAWDEYVPKGKIIQVDIDPNELSKGFPRLEMGICCDSQLFLEQLVSGDYEFGVSEEWLKFIHEIRSELDIPDKANTASGNFVELHKFVRELSNKLRPEDVIIPCSSGGTFNAVMQMFQHKGNQKILTNKSLASMGYGLSGAIGASFANPNNRIVLLEGDGGFAQNLQELGTVAVNNLNLKIFLTSNKGYASIRTTQKSYFSGNYLGCDESTGLGLPRWEDIFKSFNIPVLLINQSNLWSKQMIAGMESSGPIAFVIELDPEQLFYPKVTSRVESDGTMKTNPIHLMAPELEDSVKKRFYKYLVSN